MLMIPAPAPITVIPALAENEVRLVFEVDGRTALQANVQAPPGLVDIMDKALALAAKHNLPAARISIRLAERI